MPVSATPTKTVHVTEQDLAPIIVALIRALYLGLVGAVGGVIVVLQADGSASTRAIIVGAVLGFGSAFVARAGEGLVDQNRATTLQVPNDVHTRS